MRGFRFILFFLFSALNLCLSGQNNINGANQHANDSIECFRYDTLSKDNLEATYKLIDSLFKEDYAFNAEYDKVFSSLTNGQISINIFNVKIKDIVNYNIGNGYMLGLGLRTNHRLSNIFSIGGFGNYWFKAKKANYGGNIDFKVFKSKDMRLNISYSHKFERLGDYGFKENTSFLSPNHYKDFYIVATSLNNAISLDYSTYINKYLKGFIGFEVADKIYGQQSTVNGQQIYRLSTIDFRLRIAFGEKFIQSKDGLSVEGNANPVIWLSYQKNLKDVFGSPYAFDKAEFLFRGKKDTRYLGETSVAAQLGYINGVAPVTELFNLYGSHAGKLEVYCVESFNTMRPDEFFCDIFGALYLSHNFKNLLIDFKKFHPEIIVITNIALANIIESQNLRISESQNLYCESGIVIDNIIHAGISKIGVGGFYRYGSYSYDNFKENFVFKICLGLSL